MHTHEGAHVLKYACTQIGMHTEMHAFLQTCMHVHKHKGTHAYRYTFMKLCIEKHKQTNMNPSEAHLTNTPQPGNRDCRLCPAL